MAARKRNDNRAGSSAGTVFWLAAIVIILFIFALNWGKIQETLARTNFHEIVKTQTGADKAPAAPQSTTPTVSNATPTVSNATPTVSNATPTVSNATPRASSPGSPQATPQAPVPKAAIKPQGSAALSNQAPAAMVTLGAQGQDQVANDGSRAVVSAQGGKSRSASLFFVRIDDDGIIVRQEVKRQIAVSDSPLLDSLAALLKGPSEDEIRKKLVSLVPQGTKLLSAQVRGSTAFLNFNEAFMYNHYGIEGYAGQLKQIVYTATSFPTVQDVQILVEGEKHDYLGGEGVYIGKPLSRNSF
jgi:spore germination protein GerM